MVLNVESSSEHSEIESPEAMYERMRAQLQAGLNESEQQHVAPQVRLENGKPVPMGDFLLHDIYRLPPDYRKQILDDFMALAIAAANRVYPQHEPVFGTEAAKKSIAIPLADRPLDTELPLDHQQRASGEGQRSYKNDD